MREGSSTELSSMKEQRLQNKSGKDFKLTETKASVTNLSHTKTCCTGTVW